MYTNVRVRTLARVRAVCVRGKMEGLCASIAFPLVCVCVRARVRLHQQGKKKLIPTLSQRERNTQ